MSEKDWISKYPLSFTAYLADESQHRDKCYIGDERMFPESMIGDYLNWFLLKSGKDQRITHLESVIKDMSEILEFYAKGNATVVAFNDFHKIFVCDSGPFTVTGERAREALSKHKELLDQLTAQAEKDKA